MKTSARDRRWTPLMLWILLGLLFLMPVPVSAKKQPAGWSTTGGKVVYRNDKGKKVKGLQTIGKHTYYFDAKGVQRTGWRKVGSAYYFFRQRNGRKGYMVKNNKINNVKLKKSGKAKLTSYSRRKIKLMIRCEEILDKRTDADMSRAEKLRVAFEYVKHLPRRDTGAFKSGGNWDMYYAEYLLDRGSGCCFCQGALFAYMANAVGYSHCKAVCSGGHGWAIVGSRYYDPNWASVIGSDKTFAATSSESGRGGRPAWASNGRYVKDLGATVPSKK